MKQEEGVSRGGESKESERLKGEHVVNKKVSITGIAYGITRKKKENSKEGGEEESRDNVR